MKAQILLNVEGAKHLIAKALTKYIDFTKRVYIAYGTTNHYFLYHLGIQTSSLYAAGCNTGGKFNITVNMDKPVVLDNGKCINIEDFDISSKDVFIKGANALWYENGQKYAAVAAADPNGGTFGSFYVKAASRGADIIIPVGHEKLIPFFVESSQNADFSTGSKIAMLKFFQGKIFTEIEAFKILFDIKAEIILAGGIRDSKGATGFLIEGEKISEVMEFVEKYNNFDVLRKSKYIF